MTKPLLTATYIGLFLTLWFSLLCYFYLDTSEADGTFEFFAMFWGISYAIGLMIANAQQGVVGKKALMLQRIALVPSLLLLVFMVLRGAFYLRAVVILLGLIQLAYNLTMVKRREVHLSCIVALVLVIYASCSARADWTMLFYIVPFLLALVFTLVSDEIDHRQAEISLLGSSGEVLGGKSWAVLSATVLIMLSAIVLYVLTPQPHWTDMEWKFGEPTSAPLTAGEDSGDDGSSPSGDLLITTGASSDGTAGEGEWFAIGELRRAMFRKGMPQWQSWVMGKMATGLEGAQSLLSSLGDGLKQLGGGFMSQTGMTPSGLLLLLLLLLILALLYHLIRYFRLHHWCRTRWDYFTLPWLKGSAKVVALDVYHRTERLFAYYDPPRDPYWNATDYRAVLVEQWPSLASQIDLITNVFERARYSDQIPGADEAQQAAVAYEELYQQLGGTAKPTTNMFKA